MLDENLRVLGRRVHDLELEVTDKKERILVLERENKEISEKLGSIYREQQYVRQEVEDELMYKLEEKDKEIRKMKEEIQN